MDATSVSCDGGQPTTTVVRGALWLVASWVGVAVLCVVGNASLIGLDDLAGDRVLQLLIGDLCTAEPRLWA